MSLHLIKQSSCKYPIKALHKRHINTQGACHYFKSYPPPHGARHVARLLWTTTSRTELYVRTALYPASYIPYSQSLEQLFVCQPVMGTGAEKNSLLAQIIPGKLRLAFQTCYYALTERK